MGRVGSPEGQGGGGPPHDLMTIPIVSQMLPEGRAKNLEGRLGWGQQGQCPRSLEECSSSFCRCPAVQCGVRHWVMQWLPLKNRRKGVLLV